jgi:dienelactone hydrolase
MLPCLFSLLLLPAMATVRAEGLDIETKTVTYQIGADAFEGCVSRPVKTSGLTPGVLVVHDWKGFGPFSRARAEQLAKLGYIAFAVDMYGKGIYAKNSDEAGKLAGPFYKDSSLFRARSQAALAELLKQPDVDAKRIGAIGFCFGGTTVLELARSGAQIEGVVSFHGGLKTSSEANAGTIKAKELLVLHGSLDPTVPPADVANFMKEMNAAGVAYKLVAYPKTVHAFTSPDAGSDITKPVAYNPQVAEAAYEEMEELFARLFKGN